MKLLYLLAIAIASPAMGQTTLRFEQIVGWWSADPVHDGESAHLAVQFIEKDGKPEARLSAPALGVYDLSLGEVVITGDSLITRGLALPLRWDATTQALTGDLPADIVPIYRVPVEFRRGTPLVKPPANNWPAPRPTVLWTAETGAPVWAGIERDADGTLYVGNEAGDLTVIDRNGRIRWTFATKQPIRGQPRVIGAHVFVASDSGELYKLDRKSGREAWRVRVVADAPARIPTDQPNTRWDRYGSSVVADKSTLYFASRDKNLYALDIKTGRERWRVAATDLMTATPALHGGNVIFAALDGKVTAVSAQNGAPRWTYDAKLGIAGDVVVSGDRVLVGSRTYDLIALDAATGKELWKHYYWFSWIESPPVVRDGVVYTGSSDATNIYAIDLATGSLRWKTAVPGYSWQRAAVDENWVIAGTSGAGAFPGARAGSLVALDRATGSIRWIYLNPPTEETVRARRSWGIGASPVIGEGRVYAADLDGKVIAVGMPPRG